VIQVYADTEGSIGWVVAGFYPMREDWDGLLRVPGDGWSEWKGFLCLMRSKGQPGFS
jgi:penicillin amidase